MRKYFRNILFLIFCMFVYSGRVFAAGTSADGTVSVVIVEQASVESVKDMDFGTLISPGYQGDFTLSTSGLLTCASGWVCTGTPSEGEFKIYSNQSSVTVTRQDGILSDGFGHTLTVKVNAEGTVNITNGTGTLSVGAELSIPYGTQPGSYSTSNSGGTPYKITVNY